ADRGRGRVAVGVEAEAAGDALYVLLALKRRQHGLTQLLPVRLPARLRDRVEHGVGRVVTVRRVRGGRRARVARLPLLVPRGAGPGELVGWQPQDRREHPAGVRGQRLLERRLLDAVGTHEDPLEAGGAQRDQNVGGTVVGHAAEVHRVDLRLYDLAG